MLRFLETKAAKEDFNGAKKQQKNWYIDVTNIVISKLVEKRTILSIWLDIYIKL